MTKTGIGRRACIAGILTSLVMLAGPVQAEPSDDSSPDFEAPVMSEWSDANLNVHELDLNVRELQKNIEPLETSTSEGSTTVMTLSSDILFGFGESSLDESAKNKIADLVKDVPQGAAVKVDGHTDNIPFKRGNDVLSQERAQSVADAIHAARPDLKLEVKGHGESDPVEPNESGGKDNPEGRAKNRRVEIRYDG